MMVRTQRGDVNVLDSGEGHPVLLLHPLALSAELWRPLMESTDGLRLIAVDARGHGGTPWGGEPFTMQDMADDAAAVLDALEIENAGLFGLSMGGSTAVVLAGTRPERFSSLVLSDTTACYGDDREAEWATRAERAAGVPRKEQLSFQVDRWFSPRTIQENPQVVQRVCDLFAATDSEAHAAACRAMGGLDARHLLAEITAPTLVMVGADDFATPEAMARELHEGIPGSRLEVVPGARHLSVLDQPRAWELAVEHFRTHEAAVSS
jgi:3-oxoadipate enol-lactonase